MQIKAINFDFYGTIVDWLKVWISVSEAIIRENNLDSSPEKLALEWRKYQRDAIQGRDFLLYKECIESGLTVLCKKYEIKNKNYHLLLYEKWKSIGLFPEVSEALVQLKSRYKIAVCTNSSRDLFDYCTAKLPVKFDFELLSDETKATKPHREMYEIAVKSLGFPIENILHVASSTMDVKGAGNFGFTVCWINRQNEALPSGTQKPRFEIKKLNELFGILH